MFKIVLSYLRTIAVGILLACVVAGAGDVAVFEIHRYEDTKLALASAALDAPVAKKYDRLPESTTGPAPLYNYAPLAEAPESLPAKMPPVFDTHIALPKPEPAVEEARHAPAAHPRAVSQKDQASLTTMIAKLFVSSKESQKAPEKKKNPKVANK
jgi:hypothetical protein